jgi:hypothetical protein
MNRTCLRTTIYALRNSKHGALSYLFNKIIQDKNLTEKQQEILRHLGRICKLYGTDLLGRDPRRIHTGIHLLQLRTVQISPGLTTRGNRHGGSNAPFFMDATIHNWDGRESCHGLMRKGIDRQGGTVKGRRFAFGQFLPAVRN